MNPRVIAWMAATGHKTIDGAGHHYMIWIRERWVEWFKLQDRPANSPILERDHAAFDAWLRARLEQEREHEPNQSD